MINDKFKNVLFHCCHKMFTVQALAARRLKVKIISILRKESIP
jgi:hypothetical protein